MKNLTLLAAMAVCGVGIANAQYVGDPALSKQLQQATCMTLFFSTMPASSL